MRIWRAVEIVCSGLWVGAALGFGALMAPLLFQIVHSRQTAGDVAGAVVHRLELAGVALLGLAAVAVVMQMGRRPGLRGRLALWVLAVLLSVLDLTWVRGGLDHAQAAMDRPIETYAQGDARRVEYNVWHQRSRSISSAYGMLALAAFAWAAAGREREEVR